MQTQPEKRKMEKWEYLTRFMWANKENWKADESVNIIDNRASPTFNRVIFTPIHDCDPKQVGGRRWELVHMEPVPEVGNNEDVGFPHGGANLTTWSNVYFCVC